MATASNWSNQRKYLNLFDPANETGYPGNHFAFRHVLTTLHERKAKRLLEVGVGNGNAVSVFSEAGLEFFGFDNNHEMVERSQVKLKESGLPVGNVIWGDVEDSVTLSALRAIGGFDGLVAMGVLPHVAFERSALSNMFHLLNPGGTVFVECRNQLFSLFTFNRFTYEFIMDELLGDVDPQVKQSTEDFLKTQLDVNVPPSQYGHSAKQHNPLTIEQIFRDSGFTDIKVRPFHYHAALPRFEASLGRPFRAASIRLENESSDWRGLFLCSAFLVEAQRPEKS
jgi:2-polyprenyl-3-methyl-5-hydroxy-6-metoxy-1,4-benzoquinol methylase